MNITVVTNTPIIDVAGGLETLGGDGHYFAGISRSFETVNVVAPQNAGGRRLGYVLRQGNIRWTPLAPFYKDWHWLLHCWTDVPRIVRAVAKADVVNPRLPSPQGLAAVRACMALRKPMFVSVVGDYTVSMGARQYDGWRRWVASLGTAIYGLVERRWLRNVPVVANGSELADALGRRNVRVVKTVTSTLRQADVLSDRTARIGEAPRLLFVGSITPGKGVFTVVDVAAELLKQWPEVGLTFVGEGDLDGLRRYVEDRGLTQNTIFTGAIPWGDELLHRYRAADYFLFPTEHGEGTPRVVLEALSQGCVVLATRIAGIPDVIDPDRNGFLFAPRDTGGMVERIRFLEAHPERKAQVIGAGLATALQHTLERHISQMLTSVGSLVFPGRLPAEWPGAGETVAAAGS